MKKIIFISIITLDNFFGLSATIKAITSDGNWNQSTTWDLNRVPICGDEIIIPNGRTVIINATVNLNTTTTCYETSITVYGNLNFTSGRKLRLASGSCIHISISGSINPSGVGAGSSEAIEINGQTWWQASDGALNPSTANARFSSINADTTSSFLTIGCAILLSTKMTDFSIENINEKISVNWVTASERDNDYFKIECSRDGSYWQEIARLKGAGNSTKKITYQFTDENPFFGTSYYRLTQYDFNGKATILETQSIKVISTKYLIYPVPVNKIMFIEGDNLSDAKIFTFNSVGDKLEIEQTFIGDKLSFNFSEIKNGIYFISIESNHTKKVEKITVVH